MFRVTTIIPCTSAVAAIRESRSGLGSGIAIASTSGEGSGFEHRHFNAWRLKIKLCTFWHCEEIDYAITAASQFLVILYGNQYVSRMTTVGDEYRAFTGGLLGLTRVLVRFYDLMPCSVIFLN